MALQLQSRPPRTGPPVSMASRIRRLVALVGSLGCLAFIGWMTLSPRQPYRTIDVTVRQISRDVGGPRGPLTTGYGILEHLSNIALFLPLGLLFACAFPRRRRWLLPVALVISGAIETSQALWLPRRQASFTDVVENVAGAAIGWFIVVAAERVFAYVKRRRRAADA